MLFPLSLEEEARVQGSLLLQIWKTAGNALSSSHSNRKKLPSPLKRGEGGGGGGGKGLSFSLDEEPEGKALSSSLFKRKPEGKALSPSPELEDREQGPVRIFLE